MLIKRVLWIICISFVFLSIGYFFYSPIFTSTSVIINYGLNSFNICTDQPILWKYLKIFFIFTYLYSAIFLSNSLYHLFFSKFACKNKIKHKLFSLPFSHYSFLEKNSSELKLLIGKNELSQDSIYLPEKSLYQNILITGTIGTGKTSSAIYPFTKQLLTYEASNSEKKIGMLILDVKGNYYAKVLEFAQSCNRSEDVIVLELNGSYTYNPLYKPKLKASILANRLKTILTLFSPNNSESYWLDEVEKVLTEAIKFCRIYLNNYVTFEEIHKLITVPSYYIEKLCIIRSKFINNLLNDIQIYDLLTSIHFFQKEFFDLDSRTFSILKSEITRITNCFISDYDVFKTFNPSKEDLNFLGFEQVISNGKIVVLNMNISEYTNLSKIIAAYLKLDFQTEVMTRLAHNTNDFLRSVCFISDEYSEYCTSTDANFFSQSREAKCINIVATQSYSSLLNTLNNKSTMEVIIQNLINKLWFRTDDILTIENAQKQIGKEEKEKISKGISENAKETVFSYFTNSLNSKNSNISESINTYTNLDFIYDTNFFTQNLENFSCVSFLSDGNKIVKPQKIKLFPYFNSF